MNRLHIAMIPGALRWLSVAAAVMLALLGASAVRAQTPPATVVVTATRDTTVDSSRPDSNFGDEKTLLVTTVPGASEQRALLGFDRLPALPQETVIHRATLNLNLADIVNDEMMIGVRCVLSPWDEHIVTWKSHADLKTAGCVAPVFAPTTSPARFEVTEVVDAWVNRPAETPNEGILLYPQARSEGDRFFESREGEIPPMLAVSYTLPPIQACVDEIAQCEKPAANAEVLNLTNGRRYLTDSFGLVEDAADIAVGDVLWVRLYVDGDQMSARYITSDREPVLATRFLLYPGVNQRTMRIVVESDRSLYVRDLLISTQWHLSDTFMDHLRDAVLAASNYLYRFTNGQFALGAVTVFQAYENWEAADVWLYASNTLRPLSYIKGDVAGPTPDPQAPAVEVEYVPGQVYLGSYWNRFGLPPGAPLPEVVDVSDDYALAFSHELGHYILGQFDAYLVLTSEGEVETSNECQGTAMGWVYAPVNHGFISDAGYWAEHCANTLANYNLQRTEWATIRQWFPWAQTPPANAAPGLLPAGVTLVSFVDSPAPPTIGSTYDLLYQAGESASRAARAFLFQGGRVLDQGKPVRGSTAITLPMAPAAGDRLCVIDIDPSPALPNTPRHQYGCEILAAGDSEVQMARDTAWAPFMEIAHPNAATVTISVTQPLANGQVQARLYPEHSATPSAIVNLAPGAGQWVGSFAVGQVTSAAYVEVWVDETNTETSPRRTAIFDYGIGGGAAPGPRSNVGFAPTATSSDGRSFLLAPPDLAIGANQFIAIQTSGGAPEPPAGLHFASQAYRLLALPRTLAGDGSVNIAFGDDTGGITRGGRAANATGAAIYVWTGAAWQPLPTRVTQLADGGLLASAPSQGQATYVVLAPDAQRMFLPMIEK
jgi:hypothetical protein